MKSLEDIFLVQDMNTENFLEPKYRTLFLLRIKIQNTFDV